MKFIHTADWHLGKLVHGIHMTEDQSYLLKQFFAVVEEEKPDAVIIAGDLYDRSVPPTNAVELLHEAFYHITTELNIPVLAISGNHDSAERIQFGNQLFRKSQLYIEGKPTTSPKPIEINGVHFHLAPFAEPSVIRQLFNDSSVISHEDALKRVIGAMESTMDPNGVHVFVGHAFVLGGLQSDSERSLSVGGTDCVSAQIFAPFHYTALGHLHSPKAINHPTVAYSGSLMKYSFSEANHEKSISIINIDDKGRFTVQYRHLQPKRDMRIVEGYLDQLLDIQFYQGQKVDDYLKVILLDEGALLDPMIKLRAVYPNVLHLEKKVDTTDAKVLQNLQVDANHLKGTLHLFTDFYQEMTTNRFTDEKVQILTSIIEEIEQGGNC